MVLTYECFLNNIIEIKTLSDKIDDEWKLEGNTDEKYNVYLKKKVMNAFKINSATTVKNNSDMDIFEKLIFCYEYHIVYSISYEVPILCFNIWNTDGKRLTMEEAWNQFNRNYMEKNIFSILTQQDHPVLQTPFLTLHPCKTNEILHHFFLHSKNPVISWLSSVGPAINLKLNNEYEKLTRAEIK